MRKGRKKISAEVGMRRAHLKMLRECSPIFDNWEGFLISGGGVSPVFRVARAVWELSTKLGKTAEQILDSKTYSARVQVRQMGEKEFTVVPLWVLKSSRKSILDYCKHFDTRVSVSIKKLREILEIE